MEEGREREGIFSFILASSGETRGKCWIGAGKDRVSLTARAAGAPRTVSLRFKQAGRHFYGRRLYRLLPAASFSPSPDHQPNPNTGDGVSGLLAAAATAEKREMSP